MNGRGVGFAKSGRLWPSPFLGYYPNHGCDLLQIIKIRCSVSQNQEATLSFAPTFQPTITKKDTTNGIKWVWFHDHFLSFLKYEDFKPDISRFNPSTCHIKNHLCCSVKLPPNERFRIWKQSCNEWPLARHKKEFFKRKLGCLYFWFLTCFRKS